MSEIEKTCATCRHHDSHKRPKIMDSTGFDDQLMFDDVDEVVYSCRAPIGEFAGKEIGLVPIHCDSWAAARPPLASRLAALDLAIAGFEARMAAQTKEDE